ncbi:MAG: hypothetical protein FJX71_00165 [Alphaproteobacteria bacterium]|nr:hypothetical protein [Alphaproteobacteria bacterium]
MKYLILIWHLLLLFRKSLILNTILLVFLLISSLQAAEKEEKEKIFIPMGTLPKVRAKNNIAHAFFDRSLKDLTVLNVGTYWGYNTQAMTKEGAIVYTIDVDPAALANAITLQRIPKDRSFHAKIGDCSKKRKSMHHDFSMMTSGWEEYIKLDQAPVLDSKFDGRFDVVAILLADFTVGRNAKRLSNLLKPKGTLVVGYATEQDFYSHEEAREKLAEFFDIASIIVRFTIPGIESKGYPFRQIDGERESSSEAYVIFNKK